MLPMNHTNKTKDIMNIKITDSLRSNASPPF